MNVENLMVEEQLVELQTNGFAILKLKDIESIINQVNDDVERLILDG